MGGLGEKGERGSDHCSFCPAPPFLTSYFISFYFLFLLIPLLLYLLLLLLSPAPLLLLLLVRLVPPLLC